MFTQSLVAFFLLTYSGFVSRVLFPMGSRNNTILLLLLNILFAVIAKS